MSEQNYTPEPWSIDRFGGINAGEELLLLGKRYLSHLGYVIARSENGGLEVKIPLRDWAARNFSPAPHKNTLCTWVREGRISPAPSFIGRAYWCESDARYISDKHEAPKRPDRRRLVDKIAD